ncbi:MAG: preprotein translocase subunit SecY [Anaerolineae bacterium]|nr:preprotein translocase subunit SecY [Anaerolineae bacterium]
MSAVLSGLREVWRLQDLRKRILITIGILLIYRLAANVPVPGVDADALSNILNPATGTGLSALAGVLDLLSGGAVSNFSVLAMGVYPYISASIIIQLLTPVVPALEELTKQGQAGRDTLNRYTYFAAIPMAIFQSVGQINLFGAQAGGNAIIPGFGQDILLTASVIAVMTAGTMFAIWLGELITEDGIGNGLSLIIFAGIVARLPFGIVRLISTVDAFVTVRNIVIFLTLTLVTVFVIVMVQEGQRRIPVKYGKRVRGTKMYGGNTTYLPLRVNTAGMIPLIFAQAFLTFPGIIAGYLVQSPAPFVANSATAISGFFGNQGGATSGGQVAYWIVYFAMVVGFTYLYTDVMIRNQNLSDALQHNGGFIPGIRPGKRTEEFINRVVSRITIVGALFLGLVAVLPGMVTVLMNIISPGTGTEIQPALRVISGGGLIIVVGVIIDTMRQFESQLVMRHRDSFIR